MGFESFKKEVEKFTRITAEKYKETGNAADIIGKKNLVVADEKDGKHLRFIDPHWIHTDENTTEDTKRHITGTIHYLEKISAL